MSDEDEVIPQPTTQQEFNLAAMEALRHLAEWTAKTYHLASFGAGQAAGVARAHGNEKLADTINAQAEETRKAGMRYHNAAMDLWEAFQKDAGDELVAPREITRVPVDE